MYILLFQWIWLHVSCSSILFFLYLQAIAEGYDLFCDSPVYAECRVKATVSSTASVPWYDATPTFVPQYDFPCNQNGIHCVSQVNEDTNQTCPDLEVRYACRTPSEDLTEGKHDLSVLRMGETIEGYKKLREPVETCTCPFPPPPDWQKNKER